MVSTRKLLNSPDQPQNAFTIYFAEPVRSFTTQHHLIPDTFEHSFIHIKCSSNDVCSIESDYGWMFFQTSFEREEVIERVEPPKSFEELPECLISSEATPGI